MLVRGQAIPGFEFIIFKTFQYMKMTAFWDVAPYSLRAIVLMMEAVSTSESSVNFYEATQRNIPEDVLAAERT
jgi:hypothetical protein